MQAKNVKTDNTKAFASIQFLSLSLTLNLFFLPNFQLHSLYLYILASILASTLEIFYSNQRKSIEFQSWIREALNASKSRSHYAHHRHEDLAHCTAKLYSRKSIKFNRITDFEWLVGWLTSRPCLEYVQCAYLCSCSVIQCWEFCCCRSSSSNASITVHSMCLAQFWRGGAL